LTHEEELAMKKFAWITAMVFSCSIAMAQAPDGGITIWPKGVPPAGTKVLSFGDHTMQIGHRDANGRVEVHQKVSDVLVVQSGAATLQTGGETIDPTPTGPNELQGSSIRGGVKRDLVPGDVIEIPAGVPHQFFIPPGGQITYLVLKVIKP
jgi:mannose-6-phosphate isomerase-like protein (cupin superfamily)